MNLIKSIATDRELKIFNQGECLSFVKEANRVLGFPIVMFAALHAPGKYSSVEEGDWSYPYDYEVCHCAVKLGDNLFLDARGIFSISSEEIQSWCFFSSIDIINYAIIHVGQDILLAESFLSNDGETDQELILMIDNIISHMGSVFHSNAMTIAKEKAKHQIALNNQQKLKVKEYTL